MPRPVGCLVPDRVVQSNVVASPEEGARACRPPSRRPGHTFQGTQGTVRNVTTRGRRSRRRYPDAAVSDPLNGTRRRHHHDASCVSNSCSTQRVLGTSPRRVGDSSTERAPAERVLPLVPGAWPAVLCEVRPPALSNPAIGWFGQ